MKFFVQKPVWEENEPARRYEFDFGGVWLVRGENREVARVVSDQCAHMGNSLRPTSAGFMCDFHGWSYSFSGSNEVSTNPNLQLLEFEDCGESISVIWQETEELLPPSGHTLDGSERLTLLAHASYLLEVGNAKVLFDPWLFGPAYWGSWGHFPENKIPEDIVLRVTHVVITHPHPDHFHLETLNRFPRAVPVFFPDFPSRIIPDSLARLGFTDLRPALWEDAVNISEDLSFAFLRPTSFWEDSSVLVRARDWVWLNQNDAGAPLNDSLLPKSIDLLSSAFDVGASGYPLTWAMNDVRREKILRNSREQMLRSISERCRKTNAKYFSPFAGWWRHLQPEHQSFAKSLPHVTFSDLSEALAGNSTELIETLPSSQISLSTMEHHSDPRVVSKLSHPWPVKKKHWPEPALSDRELHVALQEKLLRLSEMAHATKCEPIIFEIHVDDMSEPIVQRFGSTTDVAMTTISARLSREVAQLYAIGDETVTWDNLAIGYWSQWARDPDVYPSNFMRLLQLGYQRGLAVQGERSRTRDLLDMSVAEILESSPDLVPGLLSRAGLPCAACTRQIAESLSTTLQIHAVPEAAKVRLLAELESALQAQ
jgi:CMP-N-acetylneuraminate monooxygenase